MFNIIKADGRREYEALQALELRAVETQKSVSDSVRGIIEAIRDRGADAVTELSVKYDGVEPREITADEIDGACKRSDPKVYAALERAAANIRDYQRRLLVKSSEWTTPDGATLGCKVRGLERVGIYVPGGTAAYLSSVLMCAVPASVAGVGEIVMVTPPTAHLSVEVLAAARIAGVHRVFAIGGAQAVAALAFGAFTPRADKVVGPGSVYVAEAKRQLFGTIDIDMVAGPSEILIIADNSAPPSFVAADLLSQAEHDPLASSILLSTSESVTIATIFELEKQLRVLPRRDIATQSLRDYGMFIVFDDMKELCAFANRIAPEHLEIITENPREIMYNIHNAGAVFLGKYTPEPIGDYIAGPSHVLPTGGTARFFSPLSVDDFVKKTSVIEYTQAAFDAVCDDVATLAKAEGLDAHANSIEVRKS